MQKKRHIYNTRGRTRITNKKSHRARERRRNKSEGAMTRCSKVRKLKSKWNNHCKRSKGLIENMTGYNNNNKYKEKPKK